jgi:hypothetical protein
MAVNEYLKRLYKLDKCLMIYEGDSLIFQSNSKGIRPHLEAIEELGSRLHGTLMVDKIVGRAAALLILFGGAAEVHAGVISRGGRELLEKGGVGLCYEEQTEHIKMVDGRIFCPFEAMVQGIDDPDEAYVAIVEKMSSLHRRE